MWLWQEDVTGEPQSDPDLTSDVRLLRSWFSEIQQSESTAAFGYGRAWTRFSNKAYPVVVLDDRYAPFLDRWWQPLPVDRLLSAEARRSLQFPATKLKLFGIFVGRPEPSTAIEDRLESLLPVRNFLWCPKTKSRGSAGVAVQLSDGSTGILTAGHVLPCGKGSKVGLKIGRRFLEKSRFFGIVEHHSAPIGEIGWDAAIIRPEGEPRLLRRALSTRWPSVRNGHELTYTRGAKSGFVDTTVLIAGLEEIDPSPLGWKCCWLISPADSLTHGDSGASVFVRETDELLGTYVGASTIRNGTAYAAYVQDAYSLQKHLFSQWNVSF